MKNVVLLLICLLICLLILSCKKLEEKYLTKEAMIEYITDDEPDGHASFASYYLFTNPDKNNNLGWTNSFYMQRIYLHQSKYSAYNYQAVFSNYKDFTKDFFSKKDSVDCQLYECFTLNDTIKSTYENSKLTFFLEHYLKKDSENKYVFNHDLSKDSRLTIMYYCYINDYFSFYEDIDGYFFTEKILLSSLDESDGEPYLEQPE